MTDTFEVRIERSFALLDALAAPIRAGTIDGSPRDTLAASTAVIAVEHGSSIVAILALKNFVSAIALLRVQYESVMRAIWLHYAASDAWIDKLFNHLGEGAVRDPNGGANIEQMLNDLQQSDVPAEVARMLRNLKDAAWAPLNSYVHSGIQPMLHQQVDVPEEYHVQILQNTNGLTTMAAMLLAVLSADSRNTQAVQKAQLAHLDVLPPLVRQP